VTGLRLSLGNCQY